MILHILSVGAQRHKGTFCLICQIATLRPHFFSMSQLKSKQIFKQRVLMSKIYKRTRPRNVQMVEIQAGSTINDE